MLWACVFALFWAYCSAQTCTTDCCSQCGAVTEYMPNGRRVVKVYGLYNVGRAVSTQTNPLLTVLAFNNINADPTILPNYYIDFTWFNTECSPRLSLQQAVNFFGAHEKVMAGVIGGGWYRDLVKGIDDIAYCVVFIVSLLTLVASTSPVFSEKMKFPYFMRVSSSDANQAAAQYFNWTRVGTLNSQESLHATLTEVFLKKAVDAGIEIVSAESFPGSQGYEMTTQLQQFANKAINIIFMACYDSDARTVVCSPPFGLTDANKFRLKEEIPWLNGSNVVFIGTDAWLNANFLYPQNSDNDIPTVQKNLAQIDAIRKNARGTIGFTFAPGNSTRRDAVFKQFETVNGFRPNNAYADFAYDVAYVFAYGIKGLLDKHNSTLIPDPITPAWRSLLRDYLLENTNYEGIARSISTFDKNGDGKIAYSCLNVVEKDGKHSYATAGIWSPADNQWYELQDPIWPDGTSTVPVDRPPMVEVYLSENLKWAFIGIAIAACLVPVINMTFLIYYWSDERIKAATPPFLALILIGTLLSMCTIFVIAVDPTDATCIIPHWFNHMAYWIIFSCLFVKTARVWWIFYRPKPIKTSLIAGAVTAMCLLASLYLALWTGLDMMHKTSYPDPLRPERIAIMKCHYSVNWAVALYAVELAFLSIGVILAYKINKIKILKSNMLKYNESSHIALSIYSIIFVGLVIVPNILWLSEANDTQYILSCVGILVINLTLNFVLYVPKWRSIWKDRRDDTTAITPMPHPNESLSTSTTSP